MLPPAPPVLVPPLVPAPPTAASGGLVTALSLPPAPPASTAGVEHTHAANVPSEVQVWAPCWPVVQAQATLAPGTQLAGVPPMGAPASGGRAVCPPAPPADAAGTVAPPVLLDAVVAVVPPAPPRAPASTAGEEHTHGANVPAEVQVWAPVWPVTHAQATLAPGTQRGGVALVAVDNWPPVPPLPPTPPGPPPAPAELTMPPVTVGASGGLVAGLPLLQPPRDATRRHEARMRSLVTMRTMVAPFGLRRKRFRGL